MSRTDYKNLIVELDQAIELDQVDICRELLEHLDRGAQKNNAVVKKYFEERAEKIQEVRKGIEKVGELLSLIKSDQGWKQCAQKNGTTVFFRKVEDNPMLYTKLETFFPGEPHEVPALFNKLISHFNEVDLMPRWFPRGMMKSAKTEQQVTNFSKSISIRISLPPPLGLVFSPREAFLMGQGYDMSEKSSVVITVTTLKEGEMINGIPTPGISKGYAPFMLDACYFFEMKQSGIVFKMIQCLDLQSKMIPAGVMNFISKGVVPFELVNNLKKQLAKFEGSTWEERVKANPDTYADIEQRLKKFLEKTYGASFEPLNKIEDDFDMLSARGSKSSYGDGTGKKSGRFKRLTSRLSNRKSSRRLSASGKKFSKDARKSFANMKKVELYDFELKTENEVKKEQAEARRKKVAALPDPNPSSVIEWISLYVVMFLVRLFTSMGQKSKLAQLKPSLVTNYPKFFVDVE